MKNVKEALENKEKGNECMKGGRNTEAIIWYTQSLKCDPSNHLVYSNRSLAFLKEQQYYLAMEDAKKCMQLQPKWPKGYFRKGEIEFQTEHYSTALKSYRQALIMDPSDEGIKSAISKASKELNRANKADARLPWSFTVIGALVGVVIVLGDQYLTTAPTIMHFVLKIAFVGVCGTIGALAAKGYRYVADNQKDSLLEAPPDLFGDDNKSADNPNGDHKKTSKSEAKGQTTRQRAAKTTAL